MVELLFAAAIDLWVSILRWCNEFGRDLAAIFAPRTLSGSRDKRGLNFVALL